MVLGNPGGVPGNTGSMALREHRISGPEMIRSLFHHYYISKKRSYAANNDTPAKCGSECTV